MSADSQPARQQIHPAWFVLVGAVCFAYGRLLINHGHSLWVREHYQFFPIVLGITGWLTYERAVEQVGFTTGRYRPGWASFLLALLFLFAATVANSPWIAAVSILLLGHGLLFTFKREQGLTILHPWWLLILLIPFPLGLDGELVRVLQRGASETASRVLDFLGVMHVMSGNVLMFPDRQFFVEEACSGVNSVFVMLAATSIYIVWARVRWIRGVPLLLSAIWWSTVMNALRIVVIAWSHDSKIADFSEGVAHTILGIGLYLVALSLVWSTDQFLQFIFSPPGKSPGESGYQFNQKLRRLWVDLTEDVIGAEPVKTNIHHSRNDTNDSSNHRLLYGLSLAIAVAGLLQFVSFDATAARSDTTDGFERLNQQSLTSTWPVTHFERSQRDGYKERNLFGANTATWSFAVDGRDVKASVDGPFNTWHDLRLCYSGTGWTVVNSWADNANLPTGEVVDALTISEMTNDSGESAHLIFGAFNNQGDVISASSGRSFQSIKRRLLDRLQENDQPGTMQIWQFQFLSRQPDPLLPTEKSDLLNRVTHLLPQVLEHWGNVE